MGRWTDELVDERMLRREDRREQESLWAASSTRGVIVTAHYRASAAGAEILESGGNVVDAAVATSLALGVVEPAASSLGGMGWMVLHMAESGKTICLEGACRAPMRATPEALSSGPRRNTHRAVALPMLPALLSHALHRYGTRTLAEVMEPAIRLAEEGFPTTSFQQHLAGVYKRVLKRLGSAAYFLGVDGEPRPTGTWFRQPVLAKTLRRLASVGFEDFYVGEISRAIVADMEAKGGFLSTDDFTRVPVVDELDPLTGQFGDWEVRTVPHPGGGTTLLVLLQLFDAVQSVSLDPDSPQSVELFATLIRRARLVRRFHPSGTVQLEDGKRVSLADRRFLSALARELREELEGSETTHFCVIDDRGNTVSMTQSIERSFGAKIVTPELGFLYNGYLKTFKIKGRAHPYFLRPGGKARSNAAPTIAFERGMPRLAIGSTGSERMISGMFQVMTRIRFGQTPFEAVKAPRLHCTPEGEVLLEAERFSPEALERLESHGFTINPYPAWAFEVGGLQLAVSKGGLLTGVAEPRRDGATAGL